MFRINTLTKLLDLFGAGKHGFRDGNRALAIPATDLSAEWCNSVQEEIANVVEAAGLVLDAENRSQLLQAIQQMVIGAQKAVIINNATFEASVADGKPVRWDSANNRFDEAIADGTANNRAVGIADVTNSKVYLHGECPLFAGLTPNARYYLDAATPGAITTVAPTDGVKIGIAKSATTLWVDIDPGQVTAAVPTVTKLTSGSGTYNTPAGVRQLVVRIVGGGGGAAGGGTTGSTNGGTGGDTSFNSIVAKGGGGGATSGGTGGAGGTAGTGTATLRCAGNAGLPGVPAWTMGGSPNGGSGGGSVFAGGGAAGGGVGMPNTGGGGGGGPATNSVTGGGGGGGEYAEIVINNPAASYSYAVGAGGSAGAGGTNGFAGGAGGSGAIVITALY